MEVNEYSRLLHLISSAREEAETLRSEMQILNRHECACADTQIVLRSSDKIEKGLNNALGSLKKLGEEKITKVAGNGAQIQASDSD